MPSGPIQVFLDIVDGLREDAKHAGDAARGNGQPRWSWPERAPGPPQRPEGLTPAYDRSAVSEAYDAALEGGTSAAAAAAKIQGDYVAVDERALRARLCSPLRLRAMAAARRAGHGKDGGVFGRQAATIQDLLARDKQT